MGRIARVVALAALTLALVGCAGYGAPGQDVANGFGQAVKYVHDDEHNVGCWFVVGSNGGGSIACLPDGDYTR